jgi:hypothetical protein
MDYKDIAIRALRTFVQGFIAVIAIDVATINDWQTAKPVIIGAVAAGVSAVWNSLDQIVKNKK